MISNISFTSAPKAAQKYVQQAFVKASTIFEEVPVVAEKAAEKVAEKAPVEKAVQAVEPFNSRMPFIDDSKALAKVRDKVAAESYALSHGSLNV